MSEKSINSLVGLLSTKKLPDSGRLKTGNNILQGNHENNSFRAKLTNSMKGAATLEDRPYTPVPSELNNITDNDDINHILEQLSMGLQTNQTANADNNHILEQLSMGLQTNQTANTDNNHLQLNPEQPVTSLIDKLSTNQYNTKINEQMSVDIQDKPNLTELVTSDTDKEPFSQSLKLPGGLIPDSHNESSKSALNVRLNSTAVNANPLFNLEENSNDNIPDSIKAQLAEKASLAKTGINQTHQQGLTKINADNNESPNIVNSTINSREANVAKSFENTTNANNNGTNIVETTEPVNTSSDNSFFNNQDADTSYEFQANPVNIKQNTEPQNNFTNTLTQISDSNKPLDSLGNNVADNIIQNAKLYTQGGKSEIKIQLSPPELGTLKLEFSFEDDILETKITVERSAVKDVIEKDIPRLRELISNADIDVGKLDVSLQEKENGRQDFMNKDFHSDSKSKSTQDFPNQENEYYEDNADEEAMANTTESTQINYLV